MKRALYVLAATIAFIGISVSLRPGEPAGSSATPEPISTAAAAKVVHHSAPATNAALVPNPILDQSSSDSSDQAGRDQSSSDQSSGYRSNGNQSDNASALSTFDTEEAAQSHCPDDTVVWLNLNSGIYHYQGERWYGNTEDGAYVCEQEAIADGERATENGQ